MEFTRHKIKTAKGLGEILLAARKKKELTLEQAEEETKVRTRYLEALEQGRYEILPESVYTVGFLAKYAEFLDLDKEKMIALYNQERGTNYSFSKLMVERRLHEPNFSITPRFFVIAGIVLALVAIIAYISFSVHQFTSPPNLAISAPATDQIIKEEQVNIIGKTDEGVTLVINGENVLVDDTGNFNQQVKLHPGLNSFEIKAINQLKKEKVLELKVLADLPSASDATVAPTIPSTVPATSLGSPATTTTPAINNITKTK